MGRSIKLLKTRKNNMRKILYFSVRILILLLATVSISYGNGNSGLEFRLVHPRNQDLPNCNASINREDLIEYECFTLQRKDETPGKPQTFWVNRRLELNGSLLKKAEVHVEPIPDDEFHKALRKLGFLVETQTISIYLEFDEKGAKRLKELTTENVKQLLAIIVDGRLFSVPKINEPFSSGQISIGAHLTVEEAEEIVKKIKNK